MFLTASGKSKTEKITQRVAFKTCTSQLLFSSRERMDLHCTTTRALSEKFFFFFLFISLSLLSLSRSADAYKNYTVGDTLGWFDKLEKPSVDYDKWAFAKSFSLGDFLIFNTDNNHSVVQTYNFTTYKSCNYQDAMDNDTIEWSSADPSSTSPHPVSVAVPLLKVGMTYFFSGDYDGEQCKFGQQLKINVTYGQGLPASLKEPSDQAPSPVSPDSGDDDSVPDTVVPSNFNNPQNVTDDDPQPSSSIAIVAFSKFLGVQLHGIFVVVGFCLFL